MRPNNNDLIRQIIWLLERMSRGQILRVLSYANRVFVTEGCGRDGAGNKDRP